MSLKDQHLERRVAILKAMAHPVRLQIVSILCVREANVSSIAEELGVNQAIVSQQLRILRMSRLVGVERENGFSVYSLAEPHLRDLVDCMDRCCATSREVDGREQRSDRAGQFQEDHVNEGADS